MNLDFILDPYTWDGIEPDGVSWESVRRGTAGEVLVGTRDTIAIAKRRAVSVKEQAASAGAYTGSDVVWLCPAALFVQNAPKVGDAIIEDDGTRWTVLDVSLGKTRNTYRLTCRDLVLAFGLRDTISIERAALSYDAAGAAVKVFPTGPPPNGGTVLYANLPARVQPQRSDIADERGIRGLRVTHEVIVGREVAVTNEDRIPWQGGYLEIRGYHMAQRIDELPRIDAEAVP